MIRKIRVEEVVRKQKRIPLKDAMNKFVDNNRNAKRIPLVSDLKLEEGVLTCEVEDYLQVPPDLFRSSSKNRQALQNNTRW